MSVLLQNLLTLIIMKTTCLRITLIGLITLLSLTSISAQNTSYTGVFLNGVHLTQDNVTFLSDLQGYKISRGYYYLDNWGNFGKVGYKPSMNIFTAKARKLNQASPKNYQSLSRSRPSTNTTSSQEKRCKIYHGNYYRIDKANSERSKLRAQGFDPWIKYEGSLYGGTRTYSVYYYGPCN